MFEGKLLGIATRKASRAPMIPLDQAEVTIACGVAGDTRGRPGLRQVTVLSSEAWQAVCDEIGQPLPWTTRRANLLVEGIALDETTGQQLRIGDLVLEVCGETDPCGRMDEQVPGLTRALAPDWRGGVCCRVLSEGVVKVGDRVVLDAGLQASCG